jgi:hypothetical protein
MDKIINSTQPVKSEMNYYHLEMSRVESTFIGSRLIYYAKIIPLYPFYNTYHGDNAWHKWFELSPFIIAPSTRY